MMTVNKDQKLQAKKKSSSPKKLLPSDFRPSPHTVIVGRGNEPRENLGNKRLQVLATIFLEKYQKGEKRTKTKIVATLISMIYEACPNGGAFVEHAKNGDWYEIGSTAVREKVGYVFRDLLADKYKSSSKSKVAQRQRQEEKELEKQQQNHHHKERYSDEMSTSSASSSGDSSSTSCCYETLQYTKIPIPEKIASSYYKASIKKSAFQKNDITHQQNKVQTSSSKNQQQSPFQPFYDHFEFKISSGGDMRRSFQNGLFLLDDDENRAERIESIFQLDDTENLEYENFDYEYLLKYPLITSMSV